ncbi:hypothetical protein SLA2020_117720 [Shorea laevis]
MERDRRHTIAIGECSYGYRNNDHKAALDRERNPSLPASSFPSPGFIEHKVSKLDTLAGVAIKYGVEVADIKKMNGLATDLQMFALKSLQIPLPGRHPPSACLSNGSESPGQNNANQTPVHHVTCDLFDSFQSLRLKSTPRKVSPAMSSLQGYYGLEPTEQKTTSEGFEMAVYKNGGAHYLEDGPYLKPFPSSNLPLSLHRKSKSLVNGFLDENGEPLENIHVGEASDNSPDRLNEKLVRRHQKSEADFTAGTPETVLKEDNASTGAFSATAGKGLALRSKAASRTSLAADSEQAGLNMSPVSVVVDGFSGVRKSSSTSSLQDQDSSSNGSGLSSIWPTSKWSLKPDLQALSTSAITRPIFDGLPKPITGRRNKAALD